MRSADAIKSVAPPFPPPPSPLPRPVPLRRRIRGRCLSPRNHGAREARDPPRGSAADKDERAAAPAATVASGSETIVFVPPSVPSRVHVHEPVHATRSAATGKRAKPAAVGEPPKRAERKHDMCVYLNTLDEVRQAVPPSGSVISGRIGFFNFFLFANCCYAASRRRGVRFRRRFPSATASDGETSFSSGSHFAEGETNRPTSPVPPPPSN